MTIKLISRETEGELLLEGRMDSKTAPEVGEIFQQMAERFDRLILNMAGIEYVSSAGLRILTHLHMTMRKKDGELVVKNVNRMVMEVFEITGFVGLVKFE